MRLIDIDKVINDPHVLAIGKEEIEKYTVKAIPIEWINNWLNTGRNAKYFIPMMRMVEDWEKEK